MGGLTNALDSPVGPDSNHEGTSQMKVHVDDVWATASTLHLRVTVSDDDGRWRHRYYPVVKTEDIPEEALRALMKSPNLIDTDSHYEDLTLF